MLSTLVEAHLLCLPCFKVWSIAAGPIFPPPALVTPHCEDIFMAAEDEYETINSISVNPLVRIDQFAANLFRGSTGWHLGGHRG